MRAIRDKPPIGPSQMVRSSWFWGWPMIVASGAMGGIITYLAWPTAFMPPGRISLTVPTLLMLLRGHKLRLWYHGLLLIVSYWVGVVLTYETYALLRGTASYNGSSVLIIVGTMITYFILYPVWIVMRSVRARPQLKIGSICERCGYDLTGLPTRTCPECGTEFER